MAALVLAVLLLAMTGRSSASWCVCKDGVGDANLQRTLDYACGAGADCNPIHTNGPCYNPNTVKAHCSYAVNSYFQKKGQSQGTCDFAGTATLSTTDPSYTGCSFPASASTAGTSTTTPVTSTTPTTTTPVTSTTPTTTTPSTTTPSTMNPNTNTPTGTTPYSSTTPTGVLGGVGTGLGPSGAGINTDYSHGGYRLRGFSLFTTFLIYWSMLLLG